MAMADRVKPLACGFRVDMACGQFDYRMQWYDNFIEEERIGGVESRASRNSLDWICNCTKSCAGGED
jgi:hypothetical protein